MERDAASASHADRIREDGTLSAPPALGTYKYDAHGQRSVPDFPGEFRTIEDRTWTGRAVK